MDSNSSTLTRREFLKGSLATLALSLFPLPTCSTSVRSVPGSSPLFPSFFWGGFECSCHRLRSGRRLDMIRLTRHDEFVSQDYARLKKNGILACRDGIRWPLVEKRAGEYRLSETARMVQAARERGIHVAWDLFHYGWPDELNIFSPAFINHFRRYARAVAQLLRDESNTPAMICPVNEISFFSWAGGDVGYLNPFCNGHGMELKAQLVRAAIEAMEEILSILPDARFLLSDPLIYIRGREGHRHEMKLAEYRRRTQFQAWDMLAGDFWPELGGNPKYLDIIGLNFYSDNEWFDGHGRIPRGSSYYRPLSDLIREVWQRYRRPMMISETGTEGTERASWLRYVSEQALEAIQAGCDLNAITLYPVVNHPGWDDGRHCQNGLWDYANDNGDRTICQPLAEELARQQSLIQTGLAQIRSSPEKLSFN